MYTDAKIEIIQRTLQLARQRRKACPQINPWVTPPNGSDITETITYIAHVEHLLLALENAVMLNQLQSRNIRTMIDLLASKKSAPIVENTEVAYP